MHRINLNVVVTLKSGTLEEKYEIPYDEYTQMLSKLSRIDRSGKKSKVNNKPLLELKPGIRNT